MDQFIAQILAKLDTRQAEADLKSITDKKYQIDVELNLTNKSLDVNKILSGLESSFKTSGQNIGKSFNTGLQSGMSTSKFDGNTYIKNYLDNFPKVQKFMDETVESGMKNGYVTTIFGRRRYIPELSSSNKVLQAFGKRAAMNAPIQGAAADIIKIAMVAVYKRLRKENLDAKLILQVHDELIIESDVSCADKAAAVLKEEMENCVKLAVPMTADVNQGESWYTAKG